MYHLDFLDMLSLLDFWDTTYLVFLLGHDICFVSESLLVPSLIPLNVGVLQALILETSSAFILFI